MPITDQTISSKDDLPMELKRYLFNPQPLLRGSVDDDGDARYSHLTQTVPDGFVGDLQTDLQQLGFDEAGTPDGAFGRNTKKAVRAFQALARLEPTGLVDRATKDALIAWLREGYARDHPPQEPSVASPPAQEGRRFIAPRVA